VITIGSEDILLFDTLLPSSVLSTAVKSSFLLNFFPFMSVILSFITSKLQPVLNPCPFGNFRILQERSERLEMGKGAKIHGEH
jgi:hypothetical protein